MFKIGLFLEFGSFSSDINVSEDVVHSDLSYVLAEN